MAETRDGGRGAASGARGGSGGAARRELMTREDAKPLARDHARALPSARERDREHAHRAPRAHAERARVDRRGLEAGAGLERHAVEREIAAPRAPPGLEVQLARRRAGHEQALGALALARQEALEEELALVGAHEVARAPSRQVGRAQRQLEAARAEPQEPPGGLAPPDLEAQRELEGVGHEGLLQHQAQAILGRELVPAEHGRARAEHHPDPVEEPVAALPRAETALAEVVEELDALQRREPHLVGREHALELELGVARRVLLQAGIDALELGALVLDQREVAEVVEQARDAQLDHARVRAPELGVEHALEQLLRLGLARPGALLAALERAGDAPS